MTRKEKSGCEIKEYGEQGLVDLSRKESCLAVALGSKINPAAFILANHLPHCGRAGGCWRPLEATLNH